MTTITVNTPVPVEEPRGARAAVAVVQALREAWAAGRTAWARQRTQRRLVAEANEVRAMARDMARHDPRVAFEMMAAADRHERG